MLPSSPKSTHFPKRVTEYSSSVILVASQSLTWLTQRKLRNQYVEDAGTSFAAMMELLG